MKTRQLYKSKQKENDTVEGQIARHFSTRQWHIEDIYIEKSFRLYNIEDLVFSHLGCIYVVKLYSSS